MDRSAAAYAKKLLSEEVRKFISEKSQFGVSQVALTKNPFPDIPWKIILDQVSGRAATIEKLPTWNSSRGILFPDRIPIEQSSSEEAAKYKSSLVSGESIADLTGGFGVDSFYFSKIFGDVFYCEQNPQLFEITMHNFKALGCSNVQGFRGDSFERLNELGRKFDWLYIDPARRSASQAKVFMLKDCTPNVPEMLDSYFEFAPEILVKTSPVLDITAAIRELKNVVSVHVVAVKNEVKELLFHLKSGYHGSIQVTAANIQKDNIERLNFIFGSPADVTYSEPISYLYEPNAAIMKSGAFDIVSEHFKLEKLDVHSHLYTSGDLIDFPGRIFRIERVLPYSKASMKELTKEYPGFNVTSRNFPENAESIYSRWKIKPGGDKFCFFTTAAAKGKIVLLCSKIK